MITVLGSGGFIGSHLVRRLDQLGVDHQAPERDASLTGRELGHIVYCIGLTADFRQRPCDAVEAHVGHLVDIIRSCTFDSLLYLSSARVYLGRSGPAREDDALCFRPLDGESVYSLSKAAGEALVLSLEGKGRIARPSSVYGEGQNDRFLNALLDEARQGGLIRVTASMDSVRDYISVEEVADLLIAIALRGRERIYNLASGVPVRNGQLVEAVCAASGCRAETFPALPVVFPTIDNQRIREEFEFVPTDILRHVSALFGDSVRW